MPDLAARPDIPDPNVSGAGKLAASTADRACARICNISHLSDRLSLCTLTRHNSATVTYRLAPETVAACFAFLRSADLLRASQVSRYWRSVALHFSSLWAEFTLDLSRHHSQTLFQLFLSRSGSRPLACKFYGDLLFADSQEHSPNTSFSELICTSMPRFRALTLEGYWSLYNQFAKRPAPNLESLTLIDTKMFCELFDGRAPNLRKLETRDVFSIPACSAFANVTHLEIVHFLKQHKFSVDELVGNLPQLESLSIYGGYLWLSLPKGTVSRSPAHMSLWVYDGDRSLALFCNAWRKLGCQRIELEVDQMDEECFLARISDGALALSVDVQPGSAARFEFRYSKGDTISVTWDSQEDHLTTVGRVARYLAARPSCFHALRSIRMTDSVLSLLLDEKPPLPSLIRLHIDMRSELHVSDLIPGLLEITAPLLASVTVVVPDPAQGTGALQFLRELEGSLSGVEKENKKLRIELRKLESEQELPSVLF